MPITYSIVVPIYNDVYLAEAFCSEFENVMKTYLNKSKIDDDVELIFIDDGSRTPAIASLEPILQKYRFARLIELARNFGQHSAIACGFREAKGQFVGRLNIDMQDPPSEIPRLLEILKSEDADIAIGQYDVRESSLLNKFTAWVYFRIFNFVTGLKVPQNTSPLRIMNRRYTDAYNSLKEQTRFPQGLEEWFGFKRRYVTIEHRARPDKKSSYNFLTRFSLAVDGVISFSDTPLKLILYAGFFSAFVGFAFIAYLIICRLLYNIYLPGYISLVSVIVIGFGIQTMCVGISGLYLGRILRETQNRPLYLIRNRYSA